MEFRKDSSKGGVTATFRSETVGGVAESRFVDGFENHPHDLLHYFISWVPYAKGSSATVFLGDVYPSTGGKLKFPGAEFVDYLIEVFIRQSV